MICEDCCQYYNSEYKCLCNGGEISVKRIGAVKGCVVFSGSQRCKKECEAFEIICDNHLKKGIETDGKFISKLFS
jgi:hypothetical protein